MGMSFILKIYRMRTMSLTLAILTTTFAIYSFLLADVRSVLNIEIPLQMEIKVKNIINELTVRKIDKCTIDFDGSPTKVYYSGEVISGSISLTMGEKKKVRGVFAQIVAVAYVRFTEMNGQNNTEYTGREILFEKRIELVPESNDTIRLLPGSYTYPFQYQLPDNLPSSLEFKYGYIRYKLRVVLDDSLWSNEEFINTFTVIGVSNLAPHILELVSARNSKSYNLFCFGDCFPTEARLETVAELSSGGYLPRQTIQLHMHVNNKSSQPVIEFTVMFVQKIQYFTHSKSSTKKTDKIVLKREDMPGCEVGEEREFDINITVPTVPPSTSICKIIKIQYYIRIIVSVPCCHTDPEIYLPLAIGSSPIQYHPSLPAWINPIATDFD